MDELNLIVKSAVQDTQQVIKVCSLEMYDVIQAFEAKDSVDAINGKHEASVDTKYKSVAKKVKPVALPLPIDCREKMEQASLQPSLRDQEKVGHRFTKDSLKELKIGCGEFLKQSEQRCFEEMLSKHGKAFEFEPHEIGCADPSVVAPMVLAIMVELVQEMVAAAVVATVVVLASRSTQVVLAALSSDAFKERHLQLQEVRLDRVSALEHYGQMQEKALEKINEKVKSKDIKKHDLVLRYNSKLDKTFQKKFQIKWEGLFKVVECFSNGTYQLANLDGVLHKSRVNGLRLKLYHARLMMVEQDELFAEQVMYVRDEETCDAASLRSLFTAADDE
ncbi:hypothetical protein L7F22_028693 [Adiantum nelumboides]|nr:hypothetical protein [Adiantum nelumboides]